jgi:hypothetical protein
MVHKLLFSMPPGTPPQKVLEAVKRFAREEFALQFRYALVLHRDEPHPHVHMLVKATNDQGRRLNIRKATLRQWRSEFARHLRELGIPANATERAVRGETIARKSDGIYRANLRGDSTHVRERAQAVTRDLSRGFTEGESGRAKVLGTRDNVRRGWWALGEILVRDEQQGLAAEVRRFAEQMPPAMTERERLAKTFVEASRPPPVREGPSR